MSPLDKLIYETEHNALETEDRMILHRRRFDVDTPLNREALALIERHQHFLNDHLKALRALSVRISERQSG